MKNGKSGRVIALINLIAGGCFAVLTWYWIKTKDPNITKLQKIFEANNLKVNDQTPMFSKKKGNVYLFRLPEGLTADAIKDKKKAFEDAFPDNAIDISYKHALRIVIADPLPEEVFYNEDIKGWAIPIGQSIEKVVKHDVTKYPHMLAAGMTRYGKTVFLKLLICFLILSKPTQVQFALIDLKGGLAFNRFRNLKQTKWNASDIEEALTALTNIKKEVDKRLKAFKELGIEKIEEMKHPLPRIFVIIDEAAELSGNKKCEELCADIARRGAGLGIHLVYCTQYPTKQTLPQQVKQNCDATISFQLRNSTASRVVFDEGDKAEKLPHIRGRAIYRTNKDIEIQVFKITDEKINEIIKNNQREEEKIEPPSEEDESGGTNTVIFR